MPKLSALIVDDVPEMAETIANDLRKVGFETRTAPDGRSALSEFTRDPSDVVVTDLRMKGGDGLDLLAEIKQADPATPVIIMTAFGAVETAVEAMRRGAYHYVTKPFALETLRALVERACRERTLSRENALLRRTLRSSLSSRKLLGNSLAMRQLRALIVQIADASSSVLIAGETGTGKELVAQAIHTSGPRADRSFVAVNCAALPEHLLESELFGHARGAFTGAATSRRGLFVEAQEGTIFLDEIGDLPLPLQGKLLRVLQSGEVRPVGSETTRTVDVRCVAATHKDLSQLVESGAFREDLFFRLDVLRVRVPPLRERSEDIAILVDHFLRQSVEKSSRSILVGFEPEALEFLATCDWPGNVRQLENVIERLVVTATHAHVRLEDVKRALGPAWTSDPIPRLLQNPMTLHDLEERYLAGILKMVGGNKIKAAEILGVDPSTVYRRHKRP
ncbi:MAG TPA: sigma-54 dependent transcriptional regulator [Polyangia bacterium]|nr:sigma-54 dependent transcriptional regulator [Polyangia bacterium]